MGGFPEGTIHGTGELGSIAHEGHLIGKAMVDQRPLDRADPTVGHIGRRNDMCACTGIRERHFHQTLECALRMNRPIRVQKPTVAMGGVLAQTEVGDEQEVGEGLAQSAEGRDDGPEWPIGICGCPARILSRLGTEGDAEEHDGFQTGLDEGREVGLEAVDAPSDLARDGVDRDAGRRIVLYKDRV